MGKGWGGDEQSVLFFKITMIGQPHQDFPFKIYCYHFSKLVTQKETSFPSLLYEVASNICIPKHKAPIDAKASNDFKKGSILWIVFTYKI